MKIAFFHELHSGGAKRSVYEFARQLGKNHKIDLYFTDKVLNKDDQKIFDKIYFYNFTPKKWTGGNWSAKFYKDTLELLSLHRLHQKIAKVIDSRGYDLVFIEPSKLTQAPFILKFLKTKKVYYCQEPLRMVYEDILKVKKDIPFFKYYYEKLNRFIRKHIDRSNIMHADIILANSKYTQKNIKSAYDLESKVCYMGVDTQIFKPISIKKDIDVLFIGAYEYADGYDLLKDAKKYLKENLKIKVLASEKQWITDDADIRRLYCRSKIILALAFNEPFGLIPIEAMACGVPIIAVNDGGYRETVLDRKTGFLIDRDPKDLAKKINHLLSNPAILNKMSIEARRRVESNWTWSKSAEELEIVFSKHFP